MMAAVPRSATDARIAVPRPATMRIATYNVHAFRGTDGRCDPSRVAQVVAQISADVVALQEMTYPADVAVETRAPVVLPELSGYECALGPTRLRRADQFGNVLLSRFPIRDLARIDLSEDRREPRGALHVVLDAHGTEFHVFATHLGLHPSERRLQVGRLVDRVRELAHGTFAVLGDFNDWLPGRSLVRALDETVGSPGRPRSFPSRWPLLPLDRIWVHPRDRVRWIAAHASPLARRASDHLPVVAELELPPANPRPESVIAAASFDRGLGVPMTQLPVDSDVAIIDLAHGGPWRRCAD